MPPKTFGGRGRLIEIITQRAREKNQICSLAIVSFSTPQQTMDFWPIPLLINAVAGAGDVGVQEGGRPS